MLDFPPVDEVPLQNAPVAEVICQVRFPPILRINAEQPVDFQEAVRDRFPQLELQQGLKVQFDPLANVEPLAQTESRVYRFKAEDDSRMIALAPNFFAVSTTAYRGWQDFLADLELAWINAIKIYKIRSATRIGLRYVDHLTQQNTQVNAAQDVWGFLRPELTALWAAQPWREPIQAVHHLVLAAFDDERLTLRAGYQRDYQREDEPICVLDFDCFAEGSGLALADLLERCERYHELIYRAFRWSIRDDRLAVFGIDAKS